MAYKEYKLLHKISQKLAENRIASLRFDFTNCIGKSEGKCVDMRISDQVQDLESSLDFLISREEIDENRIGLMGHSLGGTVSIIEASGDKRVKSIVTVAAYANYTMNHLFTPDTLKKWKEKGYMEFSSPLRGKHKISYGFYEDMVKHNCTPMLKKMNIPMRFLHGSDDKILDVENARLLYNSANEPKDIQIIEGADHLFLKDPYMSDAANLTTEWFSKYL